MIRTLILRKLDKVEQELGESVDYLRHIVRTSLPSFFRFAKVAGMANGRKVLPLEPFHVARLVGTRDADCGTCLQIELNLARQAGLSEAILAAVIDEQPEALSPELEEVYRFTRSVVVADGGEQALRESLRARYGDAGLVELALAIAGCRVFPVVKRTLGYATSCSNVALR